MTNLIKFSKMHGLGNDFVVIDKVTQHFMISPKLITAIADRRLGIGCDQILIVEPPTEPDMDFFLRIYNQDGSEARQCGNGARCFGRFIHDRELSPKTNLQIGTLSGKLSLVLLEDKHVSVKMGVPQFSPQAVPTRLIPKKGFEYDILFKDIKDMPLPKRCHILSMGNPHCVITVADIHEVEIKRIGEQLQDPALFPEGVNVSFVQPLAKNHILLRTFERGVGETPSCGSAACAAVVTGIATQELSKEVKVSLTHGSLTIKWPSPDAPVELIGPTQTIFQGHFLGYRVENENN
jgi:diaminopimelate epimerase